MKQKNLFALVLVLFVLSLVMINASTAFTAGTPEVSPGANLTAMNVGAVRYRALGTTGDKEVFLGVPDLGIAGNRTQLDLTWGATNAFTFVYDHTNDKLTTSITNGVGSWTLDYPNFSTQVTNLKFGGNAAAASAVLDHLNYLDFTLKFQGTGQAEMQLQNLSLDGNMLGTFAAIQGSTLSWKISGYDFSEGFTLSGTLTLTGNFPASAEVNKIDIMFGHVDADPPTVTNVQADPNPVGFGKSVTVTALAEDSLTGESLITSAEYTLDGGTTWNPMSALDGVFDESSEEVTATFTAPTEIMDYDLCVRATDAGTNQSAESCITLSVVDDQGPAASAVDAVPNPVGFTEAVSLTALVDDSASGASDIDNAEYSLDGGTTWTPMLPDDGAYDNPVEAVKADFSAPSEAGEYDLCVHGMDVAGNTGTGSCITLTVTDDQGPLTSAVLLTPNPASFGAQVVLTATVDDTTTGDSPIANAEYSQDGGTNWLSLEAVDGTFDTVSEQVTASFTASTVPGTYSICVRGTDAVTNLGESVCVDLQVKDTQGPISSGVVLAPNPAMIGEPVTLTAQVSDATTGGSKIVSAQYSLNNGTTWLALQAQDGVFNSVTELVTVSFTAPDQPGEYTVCVRGKDAAGKTGAKFCVVLQVEGEPKMMKVWYFPIINRTSAP